MFSRKRRPVWMASLEDEKGQLLYHGVIERLSFEESYVLALCMEFFGDPNPCEIHRSAVVIRAIEELRAACVSQGWVPVCELTERIRGLLCGYPDAAAIHVWDQQEL